ncbi:hypothetical protein [Mesorhizobium sp. P5_C1]
MLEREELGNNTEEIKEKLIKIEQEAAQAYGPSPSLSAKRAIPELIERDYEQYHLACWSGGRRIIDIKLFWPSVSLRRIASGMHC